MNIGERYYMDVESLWQYFCVAIKRKSDGRRWFFEIDALNDINEAKAMTYFFKEMVKEEDEMFTFNGVHYDCPVINYVCAEHWRWETPIQATYALKAFSNTVISAEGWWRVPILKPYKYAQHWRDIDAFTYWSLQLRREKKISLKAIGIQLGYPVVQETPIHFDDDDIDPSLLPMLREYNEIHDIGILEYMDQKIFYWQGAKTTWQDMIDLRYAAIEKGLPPSVLSWDAVKMGVRLITNKYRKSIGEYGKPFKWKGIRIGEIIPDEIQFQDDYMKRFLDELKETFIYNTSGYHKRLEIHDTVYDFKCGGLHNHSKKGLIQPSSGYEYKAWDAAGYYPSIMARFDVSPSHMPGFGQLIASEKETRDQMKLQGLGKTPEAYLIKLSLNGLIGNLNQIYSDIYDPRAFLGITLPGQLMLLMLAEEIYANGGIIDMVNTDGVDFFFKNSRKAKTKLTEIWSWWEQTTGMILEEDTYQRVYRSHGNSYMAIFQCEEGKIPYIKRKGVNYLINPNLGDSCNFLVSIKAASEYLLNGTPPEEFIPKHQNIHDFCGSQKVGKKFKVHHNGMIQGQVLNRYYVSPDGGYLSKVKGSTDKRSAMTGMKGVRSVIYNDVTQSLPYPIDYQWYINKAYEIISEAKGQIIKDEKTFQLQIL